MTNKKSPSSPANFGNENNAASAIQQPDTSLENKLHLQRSNEWCLAEEASNIAAIGVEYIEKLRAMMIGITAASANQKAVDELAGIGLYLADDFHNMMDCMREDMLKKLSMIEAGGSHE